MEKKTMKEMLRMNNQVTPFLQFFISVLYYFSWRERAIEKKFTLSYKRLYKCVYLSFFIIAKLFLKSESLIIFKVNLLIGPIGMKTAPGDHKPNLRNFISSCPLQDVPVPFKLVKVSWEKKKHNLGLFNCFKKKSPCLIYMFSLPPIKKGGKRRKGNTQSKRL